eukprot:527721-Pleurochrysis_carterae.AAC.2
MPAAPSPLAVYRAQPPPRGGASRRLGPHLQGARTRVCRVSMAGASSGWMRDAGQGSDGGAVSTSAAAVALLGRVDQSRAAEPGTRAAQKAGE